jgi:uncharacterized membrane protein YqhA
MSDSVKKHSLIEEVFETVLFNCRFLVLLAVLGSMLAAIMIFLKGAVELVQAANAFIPSMSQFHLTHEDDKQVLLSIMPAIDYFLFATVLLIFSMGLYELFISEIDPVSRRDKTRPNWLNVRSLDDLKSHMGKVIMMILIVNFFQQAFNITYSAPSDLLYLGGGILLVACSLFLTHGVISRPHGSAEHAPKPTAQTIVKAVGGDV